MVTTLEDTRAGVSSLICVQLRKICECWRRYDSMQSTDEWAAFTQVWVGFRLFFCFVVFYRWLKVNSLLEDGSTLLMSPCDVSPADKATANGKRTSSSTPNPLRALGHHCGANSDNCWPKNKKAPRLVFQLLFFFFFAALLSEPKNCSLRDSEAERICHRSCAFTVWSPSLSPSLSLPPSLSLLHIDSSSMVHFKWTQFVAWGSAAKSTIQSGLFFSRLMPLLPHCQLCRAPSFSVSRKVMFKMHDFRLRLT